MSPEICHAFLSIPSKRIVGVPANKLLALADKSPHAENQLSTHTLTDALAGRGSRQDGLYETKESSQQRYGFRGWFPL